MYFVISKTKQAVPEFRRCPFIEDPAMSYQGIAFACSTEMRMANGCADANSTRLQRIRDCFGLHSIVKFLLRGMGIDH